MNKSNNYGTKMLVVWFACLAIVMAASSASALTSTCSWYSSEGEPWVYGSHSYTATEAASYQAIESYTIVYQPISDTLQNFWFTEPDGGAIGHEALVTTGTPINYVSQGTLGNYVVTTFIRQLTDSCHGVFQFDLPSVSIVITPSIVNVGDPVAIIWNSNDADSCSYEGDALATSGVHNLIAAAADAGVYTLECSNQWGVSSASATLVVN